MRESLNLTDELQNKKRDIILDFKDQTKTKFCTQMFCIYTKDE